MSHYACKMWAPRSQYYSQNYLHPWQLKKSKSWEPFWSYQLTSTANSAQFDKLWLDKWDVKNDFTYVLQFFSHISDFLGGVNGWVMTTSLLFTIGYVKAVSTKIYTGCRKLLLQGQLWDSFVNNKKMLLKHYCSMKKNRKIQIWT